MTELHSDTDSDESAAGQNRRSFVKAIFTGAAGIVFATAATTAALAKGKRRKTPGQESAKGKVGAHRHRH